MKGVWMKRVLCDAVVDHAGLASYVVTVRGRENHEGTERVYKIKANTEDQAAREGIKRFVEDMGGEP